VKFARRLLQVYIVGFTFSIILALVASSAESYTTSLRVWIAAPVVELLMYPLANLITE
jgi:heme/copper-type cytochrome/quinol oxidase subunit 4